MTERTVAEHKKIVEAIEYAQEIIELLSGPPGTRTAAADREATVYNARTIVEILNDVLDEED